MKVFSPKSGDPSRQTAWGCFTANMAVPGFGSLAGGRWSGYPQAAICFLGMGLTFVFGAKFIVWFLNNWTHLHDPMADASSTMGEIWHEVKWALLGFALFGFSWLWALVTSLMILASAKTIPPPKIVAATKTDV